MTSPRLFIKQEHLQNRTLLSHFSHVCALGQMALFSLPCVNLNIIVLYSITIVHMINICYTDITVIFFLSRMA